MNNKKKKLLFVVTLIICICALLTLFNKYYNDVPKKIGISMEVKSKSDDQVSIYYDLKGDKAWNEVDKDVESYTKVNKERKLTFSVPSEAKNIRIDFGTKKGKMEVSNINFYLKDSLSMSLNDLKKYISAENEISLNQKEEKIIVNSKGTDPYIIVDDFSEISNKVFGRPVYINYIMVILSLILGYITVVAIKELRESVVFIKLAFSNRKLIGNLAKNDFKQRYVSSYLGVIWGFIQPLITILVYWFVFQVGFRSTDVGNGIPFILWFISGIIPWFFFSDALSSCTNVFMEYSYLVKKVVFKIESLPVIKILSSLFVQCFFILFLFIVSAAYGFYPDIYSLQVVYYLFAMIVLVYSITVCTSAVVLFFRDLSQIISIIINIGFWATPIGWNITMLPDFLQRIFKLNPMFYIVTGFRDTFIEKIYFWQRPYHTLYFWCFCIVMLLIGIKVFNKLRPHFSDVI